ncbi:MAG: hypothetical protein WA628_12300 [Terriglobales bacterium]
MKIKFDRIISIATLTASVAALVLVLKKPAPVAQPLPAPVVAANAQSFQNKIDQLEQAQAQGQAGAEVRLNAQEITAAIAQASGALSAEPGSSTAAPTVNGSGSPLSGDLGAGEPSVKDYQVNFEGDVAKGQFLTHIAGKDVWVTMEGHLGSKDGYATFEPTKIKIGDLEVPVSLVSDQLQKRLMEQRDRLKLPDNVGGIKVENGEVVVSNK